MSDFKVGDIVVCTNVDGNTTAPGVGHKSAITSIDNLPWPVNAIDLDQDDLPVAYNFSEIELFQEEK